MNLTEVVELVTSEIANIKVSNDSDLTKVKSIIQLVIDAHNKLDKGEMNKDNIVLFTSPCKNFINQLAGGDFKKVKNWLKETRSNIKVKFSENIEAINNTTGCNLPKPDQSGHNFRYYAYDVLNLSSDDWKELKIEVNQKLEIKAITFDLKKYIEITKILLNSDDWKSQTIGLIAATGRRPSEIFSIKSDAFGLAENEYRLIFTNQLKTKSNDEKFFSIGCLFPNNDLYNVYKLIIKNPDVLAKISQIDEELKELKIQDDYNLKIVRNEKIDDKFNNLLNEIVRNNYNFLPIPESLNSQKYVSCRLLRRTCATIIVSRDSDIKDTRSCLNLYNEFLGHTQEDKGSVTPVYMDFQLFDNVEFYDLKMEKKAQKSIRIDADDLEIINELKEKYNLKSQSDVIKYLLKIAKENEETKQELEKELNQVKENYEKKLQLERERKDQLKEDFSIQSWDELRGSHAPNSAKEKIERCLQAVMDYNDYKAVSNNERFYITIRLVQTLSGCNYNSIKKVFDDRNVMIADHNFKYELSELSNRSNPLYTPNDREKLSRVVEVN